MNEKAVAAARQIARKVMERERSLENEILQNAELTAEIVRARREFRAGVEFNQEPLALLAERQVRLIEARGAGAALHASFKKIAIAVFDEAQDFGCQRGCVPTFGRTAQAQIAAG